MDASRLFPGMDAQEIADLEHTTGLTVTDADDWTLDDYDSVIAYLRRKALIPPAFLRKPRREWFSCCRPARP
jgi:hypothetical protein